MPNRAAFDFRFAALAGAALLCVIALRAVFSKGEKHSLGCGFGIAAAVVLTILVKDDVGGLWGALRLCLGVLFLWPVKRVLVSEGSGTVPYAVVGLILAVAVAAEPAKKLYYAYGPDFVQSELVQTRVELESFQDQQTLIRERLDDLVQRRAELRRELKGSGLTDDALLEHPKTTLLAKILKAVGKSEQVLVLVDAEVLRLGARMQKLEAGSDLGALKRVNPELGSMLEELDREPTDWDNLDLLERTIRKSELQTVLDRELR